MADREKVIKALECHLAIMYDRLGTVRCRDCSYRREMNCSIQLFANALELLKEQNARVLTPDEYAEWCLGEENRNAKQNTWKPKTPLLIEKRREKRRENEMYWLNAPEKVVHIDKEYGKTFIVWTGYPTKEQRKKVKWDENINLP